jgi:hypothetical protein
LENALNNLACTLHYITFQCLVSVRDVGDDEKERVLTWILIIFVEHPS